VNGVQPVPTAPGPRPEAGRAALVFLALALVVFRDAVFRGRMLFQRDIDAFWNGSVEALVRVVATGAPPLWNPYPGLGQPFLAAAISQLGYPTTWLNLILPPAPAYALFVVLHVVLAACGAYAAARRLGLSWLAGVLAGVLYAFSGPYLSLVHMANMLAAAAWLPWAFAGAAEVVRAPGRGAVALWGVATAMTLLAGSPEVTLMSVLGVALALPGAQRAAARNWRRPLAAMGMAAVLGIGLSAVQWLPTIELQSRSARAALDDTSQGFWSIHPLGLAQALLPLRLDELPLTPLVRRELFEGREPFIDSIYLGLAAAALALTGLVAGRGCRRFVLGGIVLLATLLALGRFSPLYDAAREAVPLLARARYPAKFIVLAGLAWALLAALGLDAVREARRRGRAPWLAVAAVTAALAAGALASSGARSGLWGLLLVPAEVFGRPHESSPAILAARASLAAAGVLGLAASVLLARRGLTSAAAPGLAALLAVVAGADLVVGLRDLNPTVPRALLGYRSPALDPIPTRPPNRTLVLDYQDPRLALRHLRRLGALSLPFDATPEQAFLMPRAYPFGRLGQGQWGIESFSLDVPLLRDRSAATLALFLQTAPDAPYYLRLLQAAGVQYLIALHEQGLPRELEKLAETPGPMGEPVRTFRVPDPLPRAFLAGRARRGSGFDAWKTIVSPGFDPGREVLVEEGVEIGGPDAVGEARVASRRPDRLSIDVEATAPAYLVVLEGYDPGWKAWIDGVRAPVVRANAAFRGVLVPAGRHRVEMAYRPLSVTIGLTVSAVSLLALVALLVTGRRRPSAPHGSR
jgi:hypothetical protein